MPSSELCFILKWTVNEPAGRREQAARGTSVCSLLLLCVWLVQSLPFLCFQWAAPLIVMAKVSSLSLLDNVRFEME